LAQPVRDDLILGKYEIAGVVKLGESALAMLRDEGTGQLHRIRAGDRLEDADVVEITLDSLTFFRAGVTLTFKVKTAGEGTE